jgi:hypothetical protein
MGRGSDREDWSFLARCSKVSKEEFLEMMRVVNKERKKKLQRRLDQPM